MRLKDKVCLVTGAAQGIGLATALKFAREGATVIVLDLQADAVDAAVAACRELGAQADGFALSVTDRAAVDAMVAAVQAKFGRIDVLVNNAAFMPQVPLAQLTPALWRQIMAVNIDAPLLLAQALAPAMAAQGWGRIVNLASSTVWGPPPGMSAYATSKMAVIGLTRALASELGGQGITVNAISPGLTRHPGSAANLPDAAFEGVRQRQFIPRTEVPDDLTGALAFLASDDARFITGQVLNVDGGGFGF